MVIYTYEIQKEHEGGNIMWCNYCGTTLQDGETNCPVCGANLANQQMQWQQPMVDNQQMQWQQPNGKRQKPLNFSNLDNKKKYILIGCITAIIAIVAFVIISQKKEEDRKSKNIQGTYELTTLMYNEEDYGYFMDEEELIIEKNKCYLLDEECSYSFDGKIIKIYYDDKVLKGKYDKASKKITLKCKEGDDEIYMEFKKSGSNDYSSKKKTECQSCGYIESCYKYEISYDGEKESGYLCDDCAKEMKSCVEIIGGKMERK